MCGLIAVLIHNLIDFAIFEPGIFGVFWLFVAIIVAQVVNAAELSQDVIVSNGPRRLGLLAGLTLVGIVHLTVVIIPPMRAENLFKRAILDDIRRIELVEAAITADSLSSKTAYQAAGIFRQAYQQQRVKDSCFLDKALEFAHVAAARNPADFKPRRLLGQT